MQNGHHASREDEAERNLESFKVAPALGVKEEQPGRGTLIKGPGSLLSSVSEQDYFKK